MSRRIAPTLVEWANAMPICAASDKAYRELKALLAVARAAKDDLARLAEDLSLPSWRDLGGDPEAPGSTAKLVRALDRLDKVSGRGRP